MPLLTGWNPKRSFFQADPEFVLANKQRPQTTTKGVIVRGRDPILFPIFQDLNFLEVHLPPAGAESQKAFLS